MYSVMYHYDEDDQVCAIENKCVSCGVYGCESCSGDVAEADEIESN
jgi:hypothetical protein